MNNNSNNDGISSINNGQDNFGSNTKSNINILNPDLQKKAGEIRQAIGACAISLKKVTVECTINSELQKETFAELERNHFCLISMFAVEDFKGNRGISIIYILEYEKNSSIFTVILPLVSKTGELQKTESSRAEFARTEFSKAEFSAPERERPESAKIQIQKVESISAAFPAASWYEREISDGFGVEFCNQVDSRRLFLHENYPKDFHPLRKSFPQKALRDRLMKTANFPILASDEYKFREVEGHGVYQIPVGPVHAGIIPPGHFRFHALGETILSLEIRMFYLHRGIEKLSENKTPQECVKIAESICGDETAVNAYGFCSAAEQIIGINVPSRAQYLRTILLEMERIYSLLSDIAGMNVDVAYPAGAMPFFNLREEMLRQNELLTGSRFMKGIFCIGGLSKDIDNSKLDSLLDYLAKFEENFALAEKNVLSSETVIDRFETTGSVHKELVRPLNITGPIAKACGFARDARIGHAYLLYKEFRPDIHVKETGDVMARFMIKCLEIMDSLRLIELCISNLPRKGSILSQEEARDGYSFSIVEAARGQSIHWLMIKDGKVARYKIRTASFCNWQAIEHAVLKNIVPDFPLVNKSFNLSYEGTDL